MRKLFYCLFTSLVLILACSSATLKLPMKFKPEFKGVDPIIQPYYDEYMSLSASNNLTFKKPVTIGFKDIKEGNVVGICYWGIGWREIEIDTTYWNNSSSLRRYALLYHEMTHCFCHRNHDYGDGIRYPDPDDKVSTVIVVVQNYVLKLKESDGFYDDGICPKSLMYPYVVDPYCMNLHYGEYTKEMFNRCEPW